MSDQDDIEKPLSEWVLGPKNLHLVVLWGNGDVLVYEWVRGRFGRCLAAYRWSKGRLRGVIGSTDPATESRLAREVSERLGVKP